LPGHSLGEFMLEKAVLARQISFNSSTGGVNGACIGCFIPETFEESRAAESWQLGDPQPWEELTLIRKRSREQSHADAK
jgi:hypothetical protein